MFKIQEENTKEALLECIHVGAQDQYKEIIEDKSSIGMKLDTNLMVKVLEAGMIRLVVARDKDGKCIGYFCNLIDKDWLTSQKKGKELAIFVKPEYRKFGVFDKMINLQEQISIDLGVVSQILEFQIGHNEKLPLSHDYVPKGIIYEKYLGGK